MANPSLVALMFAFIFLSSHTICNANENEVDDESRFTYMVGTNGGPHNWGQLNEEWKVCESGKLQSPINIYDLNVKVTSTLEHLKPNYKVAPAIIINRGHDIKLQWEGGAGSININGTLYYLHQCHWHNPSEHQVNGKSFAMEVHMVHQSLDGRLAVIAILHNIGSPNTFLGELIHHLKTVYTEGMRIGLVPPQLLELEDEPYYRYIGSLTVPPCTEGVTWTILKKVRTVSLEQVIALRNAVHDGYETNARPIQELHGRPVHLATHSRG